MNPNAFDFSQQQDSQQGAGQPGILDQWSAALQNPATRASLMQMGLQLMQPMGFGQSPMGHFAQAVGAGGEAGDRVETQELKDQIAQNTMDRQNALLQQGEERLAIGNRNATTREKALGLRTTGGGLTAKDLFRSQQQGVKTLESKAQWEATQIAKQIADAKLLAGELPEGLKKYDGMGAGDIYRSLIADPEWQRRTRLSTATSATAAIPPAGQRQVGQVYQTPKGPMVWRGTGWAPATAAPPIDNSQDEI